MVFLSFSAQVFKSVFEIQHGDSLSHAENKIQQTWTFIWNADGRTAPIPHLSVLNLDMKKTSCLVASNEYAMVISFTSVRGMEQKVGL